MCKALLCLCARKRDFCGSDVLRRSRFFIEKVPPCGASYFARGGKVGKTPPGDGSDERLRVAGAHSYLSPGPPVTGEGNFGLLVISGGQNQDLFPSYSRALGPCTIKICKLLLSIVHRLVPAYLLGAAVVGRTSCHGSARAGGVRTAQRFSNF